MTFQEQDFLNITLAALLVLAASGLTMAMSILREARSAPAAHSSQRWSLILGLLSLPAGAIFHFILSLTVVIVLLATGTSRRRRSETGDEGTAPANDSASIIIPNWNGLSLLEQTLPALAKAIERAGGSHEVIIVDNASDDDSVAYVAENFPEFRVIKLDSNRGYAGACNEGVRAASHDIVVLLNNDMIVDEGFLPPLLQPFADARVFAVSSQIFLWDKEARRQETGRTQATFWQGFLHVVHAGIPPAVNHLLPVLYAGGGSSAFDRRKFLSMGGYDDGLFQPFYGEDCDISLRAWNRGWIAYLEPRSVVFHKHRGTIGRYYSEEFIRGVVERTQLLLHWKHLLGLKVLAAHGFWLWTKLLKRQTGGDSGYCISVLKAVGRIGDVAQRRREEPRRFVSTTQLLEICGNLGRFLDACEGPKRISPSARKKILFICPFIPSIGVHAGAGRMFSLIKFLSQTNDVSVITFMENEEESRYIAQLQEFCKHVIALRRRRSIFARYAETWPRGVQEFYSEAMSRRLAELLAIEDFDVIQTEYTQMAQYIPKTSRAVTVLTEHEVTFSSLRRRIPFQRSVISKAISTAAWLNMLSYEVRAGEDFDCVVTLTEADRQELAGYSPHTRIEVVPTGVDCSYFAPQATAEEPNSLVFVGYYGHYPNVHGMTRFCHEILPLICDAVPDVKLYIVGSNPAKEILSLHDGSRIVVTGRVPDIRPYIARSAVYVVPLWLGVGIRGKILEAWGMNKPVVSTSIGARGMPAVEGIHLLVADDPQGFADRVVRLLRDDELRRALGANGRHQAETTYDWPAIADRHDNLYRTLLREKGLLSVDERVPALGEVKQ